MTRHVTILVFFTLCLSSSFQAVGQDLYSPTAFPGSSPYSPFYVGKQIGPDGIVTERLPVDRGGDWGESPLDIYIKQVVKNSWIRLEYLSWNFDNPGNTLLGSPLLVTNDPRQPFPVTVGATLAGFAQVVDLSEVSLKNTQGLRATVGVPLTFGSIEASIYSFEEAQHTILRSVEDPPVGATLQDFIATSTFTNGQVGNNVLLYDDSFTAQFSTDLWSAETNFILDPHVPGEGFKTRPLMGFKFFDLQERLRQTGVFDQNGFLLTPLVSTIDSLSANRVYVPQIGVRFELVHKWFTLAFEPKMGFGINTFKDMVTAERIRSLGDPTVVTKERGTKFTPVGTFDFSATIHASPRFSLYVSYHLTIAGNITRPQNSIYYNDLGAAAPLTGIVVSPGFDNYVIQGLSVGGQLLLR